MALHDGGRPGEGEGWLIMIFIITTFSVLVAGSDMS